MEDYSVCTHCGEVFNDCNAVVCDCGDTWCSDDCAEKDGYRQVDLDCDLSSEMYCFSTSCNYCNGVDMHNDKILEYIYKYITKASLMDAIKNDDKLQIFVANSENVDNLIKSDFTNRYDEPYKIEDVLLEDND